MNIEYISQVKRVITAVLIVSVMIFAVGCTDKLSLENPNTQTDANFWKNEEDVLSGLAATYKVLKDINRGYFGVRGVELSNGRGDDFFIRNDVQSLYQLSTFTNNPTTTTPRDIYDGFFRGIFRANQVIENTPNASIDEAKKAELIAEAKFLRALNYFYLIINFGDVPLISSVPKEREQYFAPPANQTDLWNFIIADLTEAKNTLPLNYSDVYIGRATNGAAIAQLGKVYLYMERWEDAANELDIITKAPYDYTLLDDYEHNFMAAYDNNKESLFEVQMQNVGGPQPWAGENANESQGTTVAQEFAPAEVAGWFEAFPTNKIFQAFQQEKTADGDFDARMYASLVWDYPGALYYNRPFSTIKKQFGFNAMIRKYQNWRNNDEGIFISENNEKVIRFADVLLMRAEALVQLGRIEEAYPLIDRIRTRAKLAPLAAGKNQQAMMIEIMHQRMLEFFREGLRFYDLRRWGKLADEIAASDKEGRQFLTLPRHELFPIPQDELNTNPNMVQNPNW
ncbi:RagB/SusD family nutrient uptake outer membrane protein [Olivibacter sp. LS-1]|uniref:RagB/SusD family nutrient uptake outer membrane protein n=1 Tax=Olivibacter sp. LS-1 TaxID=2592345 RepID=UPI0011EADE74|nr:RagB/SusD family nutrient uptake outer membrane protein [Olivibacter sp. LS-1]QEL03577.1 RagB/SusD family nutrient uptake outer membrane protein [Olivibacter sp. LS-1]